MESTRTYNYGNRHIKIDWYSPDAPDSSEFEDEDFTPDAYEFIGEVEITGDNDDEITGEIITFWEPNDANDFPSIDSFTDAIDELVRDAQSAG